MLLVNKPLALLRTNPVLKLPIVTAPVPVVNVPAPFKLKLPLFCVKPVTPVIAPVVETFKPDDVICNADAAFPIDVEAEPVVLIPTLPVMEAPLESVVSPATERLLLKLVAPLTPNVPLKFRLVKDGLEVVAILCGKDNIIDPVGPLTLI